MSVGLAAVSLAIEAVVGYPDALFARVGHPVTWIGQLISLLDARLNLESDSFALRRAKGVLALGLLVATALGAGVALTAALGALPMGSLLAALIASSLLAQRSLDAHVVAVEQGLGQSLDEGRGAVAKIVGRDVTRLDEAGVARAAIESLAENFSDGVVAPALALALFGLPGGIVYKAVNTADSMIGHKSARYLAFGAAAARFDDLLNLVPARLSAALLALAAFFMPDAAPRGAIAVAWRDARRHASPNAGWPEAAMAGALDLTLGGARAYGETWHEGATLGEGRQDATIHDIGRARALYRRAVLALWIVASVSALAEQGFHFFGK